MVFFLLLNLVQHNREYCDLFNFRNQLLAQLVLDVGTQDLVYKMVSSNRMLWLITDKINYQF